MGKTKGADGGRSKTRPSSSSLAASLLSGVSGAPAAGFGGFLGSSRIDHPTSSDDSTPLPVMDSEVALHLKRLGRKDPTTKLKALESLSTLFNEKTGEEVVQIIPQWAFEYKKLLFDYNREVRQATHETMSSLVIAVRKGLALHLKVLMGPWWFSQFDPVPEVATAARQSFEAAFPQAEKRMDALMLCVKEIFVYLDDNLKLTPQAISDKATSIDELEDIHQRVISSSLVAIATLIDLLLGVKLQNCDTECGATEQKSLLRVKTSILSSSENMFHVHKYYLDFLKSKSSIIRSSTYAVLVSYVKHVAHVFTEGSLKSVSPAILGSFQELDASCHFTMWELILAFSKRFPSSWSFCNVQKVIFNRLWNFLQNGCYGSKQLSYPLLVQFLECVPHELVKGGEIFLDFLNKLWSGRNAMQLSRVDSLAFFSAFKTCFIWLLNASGDLSDNFGDKLVNNILQNLLWYDYLHLPLSKGLAEVNRKQIEDSCEAGVNVRDQKSLKEHTIQYSAHYLHDLRKCIVDVMSHDLMAKLNLLDSCCAFVKRDCLTIIQKGEALQSLYEHVEQIVAFFVLLDQTVSRGGKSWPLDCLARPLIMDSFLTIKFTKSPHLVKLLLALAEVFGPVYIFSESAAKGKEATEAFVLSFNDNFIPWCLDGCKSSTSIKLDLLISLMQEEYFYDQWYSIISYALNSSQNSQVSSASDNYDGLELLTLLLEKVRRRLRNNQFADGHNGSLAEHWKHHSLDRAAISAASILPFRTSNSQFLRVVVGGSVPDDQSFLSSEALVAIFGHLLENLASILTSSSFGWVNFSYFSLLSSESHSIINMKEQTYLAKHETAQFSLDVLEGCFFCLRKIEAEERLVSSLMAVLFFLEWECTMTLVADYENGSANCINDFDFDTYISDSGSPQNYSSEVTNLKLDLGRRVHAFVQKISPTFCSFLSPTVRSRLSSLLVQTLKFIASKATGVSVESVSSLCSQWVVDVLKAVCDDHTDLQNVLDLLLCEENDWSIWVKPSLTDNTRSACIQDEPESTCKNVQISYQFISFVDKLIQNLGFGTVIYGVVEKDHYVLAESFEVDASCQFSRIWLAAEMLCTWEWQGGGALSTFLPSLDQFVKNNSTIVKGDEIHSIAVLLFDGALMHECGQWISFSTRGLSSDELTKINEPFLRALVSFLMTIVTDYSLWRMQNVILYFEHVINKLFIGSTVNSPCLRVLPFVLSVLMNQLSPDVEEDQGCACPSDIHSEASSVDKHIMYWLDITITNILSFPEGSSEQDVADWTQLVLSCYPLKFVESTGKIIIGAVRIIREQEKSLLLTLFRKYQMLEGRTSVSSFNANTSSDVIQLIEAKLMTVSVAYCWPELVEDDWSYILENVNKSIESAVLLVEEMAELSENVATNFQSCETSLEKLKSGVEASNSLIIRTAESSLAILAILGQFEGLQSVNFLNSQLFSSGKWINFRDQTTGSIVRLFFATGAAEAVAKLCGEEASSVVASSRSSFLQFWRLTASLVIDAPSHVKSSAVEAMELWGLREGSVSSCYAVLFSSKPAPPLQLAAFTLLVTEPLNHLSLAKDLGHDANLLADSESPSLENFCPRDEISALLQIPIPELIKSDLTARERVNVFIAWALVLSHLQSLSRSSTVKEKLIQYIQDNISSAILDCIFQHIPLKSTALSGKKKEAELRTEASIAARSCKNAIETCSLLSPIQSLWPVSEVQMTSFAGSMYGMMIRLLPSYVRDWFNTLKDRSLSAAIESFTRTWCSPPLLLDELTQVKNTVYPDESFSVTVNRSAYEIVATYKKEETGMDLVIRLPSCYPLRHLDVECTRSLGISEVKQRKWLLSLTSFVRNQNGAVAEAISIWKSNFDKEFEGVEECPICYSILHTSNHSLPRLACKTCKHKFHAACLYKWFSTSNKSTCPLCQTPF